jgi:hypothetical protein
MSFGDPDRWLNHRKMLREQPADEHRCRPRGCSLRARKPYKHRPEPRTSNRFRTARNENCEQTEPQSGEFQRVPRYQSWSYSFYGNDSKAHQIGVNIGKDRNLHEKLLRHRSNQSLIRALQLTFSMPSGAGYSPTSPRQGGIIAHPIKEETGVYANPFALRIQNRHVASAIAVASASKVQFGVPSVTPGKEDEEPM